MENTRYAEERQGEWQIFESLIDLQGALNARVIKCHGASIATREIGQEESPFRASVPKAFFYTVVIFCFVASAS
jgi:hypothetical protein